MYKVFVNKVTREAILYTLMILLVYRLGAHIVAPGVNVDALSTSTSSIGELFNFFTGGNISQMSLFALGIGPYISASIIIQLLETDLLPAASEWKYQGVEGQNKRTSYTKYLALTLAFIQALAIPIIYATQTIINNLTGVSDASLFTDQGGIFLVALFLTAGTAVLMWLGDRITEKGIGNGMSVLIMAGILAAVPTQMLLLANRMQTATNVSLVMVYALIVLIIIILVIIVVIYYTLAYRKILINYVRNGKTTVRKNSYIPVKLNPAGVIPVIFATPLFILADFMVDMTVNLTDATANGIGNLQYFFSEIFNLAQVATSATEVSAWLVTIMPILSWILYFGTIVLFSLFYSQVQMNPKNMANQLSKQSAYIVGVRPGDDTIKYLSDVILHTSIWGGVILATIAILPLIITYVLNLSTNVFLLGTGLIITVNVLVQAYKAMESKIESKKYRKLIKEQ